MELRSKECIDAVLKPLTDHVTININGVNLTMSS
jgi:hypothetical protein